MLGASQGKRGSVDPRESDAASGPKYHGFQPPGHPRARRRSAGFSDRPRLPLRGPRARPCTQLHSRQLRSLNGRLVLSESLSSFEMDHRLPRRFGVRGAGLIDFVRFDEVNVPISTSRLAHPSTRDPHWAEAGAADVASSATAAIAASATGARLGRRIARMLMGLCLPGGLTAWSTEVVYGWITEMVYKSDGLRRPRH